MRKELETTFLPFVIKPGRYSGGEIGQVTRDHDGRTTYLHAYPDKYELGQSYVGLQTLYHVINSYDRFVCERAFAVDTDAEALMRRENIPLFSLETSKPVAEFDAVGFTLVDETVYTNLLAMLDLAGIPLRWENRDDSHPIIMAGGPAAFNPEPLAPFVDLFFIGDAEEGLPQMLSIIHDSKGMSRGDVLAQIAGKVESVYIPRFYDENRRPVVDFAPPKIAARVVTALKPDYYPEQPIVPLIDVTHDHLGVEIMRGCPQGCRYCMAGPIYKPVRMRPPDDVINQVETQLKNTGYGEVTLLSLSSSDYQDIEALAATLARRLEPKNITLLLPSLRPGTITPKLLDAVTRVKGRSLTIAPEAGTERLRLFIRKDFPDEAVLDTVRMAYQKGISTIKLYFMVGLPTETEEDLLGIVDLCRRIHDIGRQFSDKKTLNVTLSPFVPKAHTPFQWDECLPEQEVFERIQFVRRKCRLNHVNIRHNSTQLAQLSAVLGRGGREIAPVIERAFQMGCRFDGWSEHFNWDAWQEAMREFGVSIERLQRAIPFNADLPWSHIDKGPSPEHLRKERERTSLKLKEYTPQSDDYTDKNDEHSNVSFGRGKKKVASRASVTPVRSKVRIRWGRTDRFKYLSHLDNLRLIERIIRRADLPVAFSQGFSPAMKLSFGPPLSVGFTSESELMEITLEQQFMNYMMEALQRSAPDGFAIYEAATVLSKGKSISALLNRACYTVPLVHWADPDNLQQRLTDLLAKSEVEVERQSKDTVKRLDIRSAIYDLSIDADVVAMTLGIGDGGYARPGEILELLADGLDRPVPAVTIHRRDLYRVGDDGERVDAMQM